MPITNYSFDNQPAFEGQVIIDRQLGFYGLPHELFARPSAVTPLGFAYYPEYLPYGRVVCLVNYNNNTVNVSTAFTGHAGAMGIVPATSTRRRRFITATTYNPSNNTAMLEAGVAEGRRTTVVNKGYAWMYSETPLNHTDSVYFRINTPPTANSLQTYGRLTTEVSTDTEFTPHIRVVRPCVTNGGLVLVKLDFPYI